MYAQFFGNYLLSHGVVTREQLLETMHRKSSTKIKLGTLAIHAGYMTANEVDRIVILQTHEDKRFGELAIHEGYLTEEEVTKLLAEQKPDFLLLGQALVDEGLINNQQLQELIIDYQSENELDDYSYSEEDQDAIRHMIENFFILAERPLSKYEISFFQLLFNNLYRFIGDDFTLVSPSSCKEYPTNYCVSQKVSGSFSIRTYLDIPENTCIAFASKYVNENFTEFDEYVRSSVEDFINLHNGLFCVNMSNEFSMTGGVVEFFDVPDCHGAGIYAVEDCLHVCYLSFVGKYFLYIDQHSVWFDGICDHDGGIGADGVIYLPVDWGDTGGACDRHRDAAFSVHDRCRRQSGRARRRNIYGGCGHFLDSRVTLLSGLLPHDYGTGGGGA